MVRSTQFEREKGKEVHVDKTCHFFIYTTQKLLCEHEKKSTTTHRSSHTIRTSIASDGLLIEVSQRSNARKDRIHDIRVAFPRQLAFVVVGRERQHQQLQRQNVASFSPRCEEDVVRILSACREEAPRDDAFARRKLCRGESFASRGTSEQRKERARIVFVCAAAATDGRKKIPKNKLLYLSLTEQARREHSQNRAIADDTVGFTSGNSSNSKSSSASSSTETQNRLVTEILENVDDEGE